MVKNSNKSRSHVLKEVLGLMAKDMDRLTKKAFEQGRAKGCSEGEAIGYKAASNNSPISIYVPPIVSIPGDIGERAREQTQDGKGANGLRGSLRR